MPLQMRRQPKLGLMGNPIWTLQQGHKMKVIGSILDDLRLELASSSAQLTIQGSVEDTDCWELTRLIQHNRDITGTTVLTKKQLLRAFGVIRESEMTGSECTEYTEMLDCFGADDGVPGCFIRWEDWLNIPCAGCGYNGDPNITIFISREIACAVANLVLAARNKRK